MTLASSLAIVAPVTSGCSFLLVDGPPPADKREYRFYCTRSPLFPALDALGTVLSAARLAYVYDMEPDNQAGSELFRREYVSWNAGLIALYLASAVAGSSWVSSCRSAMDAWESARATGASSGVGVRHASTARPPDGYGETR